MTLSDRLLEAAIQQRTRMYVACGIDAMAARRRAFNEFTGQTANLLDDEQWDHDRAMEEQDGRIR